MDDIKYLRLLSKEFPTIESVSNEIINLNAILNLPKGTEHFVSDIHGEFEAFHHILKNASGSIKRRINEIFGDSLSTKTQKELATLIYYPREKLTLVQETMTEDELTEWYKITLLRLVKICRMISSKYTRSKVRKIIHPDYRYILEELLHEQEQLQDKDIYYKSIIKTIVQINRGSKFIIAISNVIKRLAVDHLHIVGDIYDRGPGAHIILDTLFEYHSVDIQWGNHDIVWLGAASGSDACIANVLRISLRYVNMETLEDGYGINLVPLASLAMNDYSNDECANFLPKTHDSTNGHERILTARMHKAITIIQFKLESQIINRRSNFQMEDRLLLDKIDYTSSTIQIDGTIYQLNDTNFPTINPEDPFKLTEFENEVVDKLRQSFLNSEKLQKHARFLLSTGSLYLIHNNNLLYHGCIPMQADGSFISEDLEGVSISIKALFKKMEDFVYQAYMIGKWNDQKIEALDTIWYLWNGKNSPLFGKDKMTTFERYFVDDKSTHKEMLNPYYEYRSNVKIVKKILAEFGLSGLNSRIINGHIPVKVRKGENPVKANGKLISIDGRFAKAYHFK